MSDVLKMIDCVSKAAEVADHIYCVEALSCCKHEIERLQSDLDDADARVQFMSDQVDAKCEITERLQSRIDELEAVAEHAQHLLNGAGDEAVHRLTEALAAVEDKP